MSRVLLHDSGRTGKLGWATEAMATGIAGGLILSPFETPLADRPRRPSGLTCRNELGALGEVFWDPTTYGVFAPGANHFEYYDTWNLWSGARGDLSAASVQDHVTRVVGRQSDLGVRTLAPTLVLDTATSPEAGIARDMAEQTIAADADAFLSVAGTAAFWAAGTQLDAFVGDLARLRPAGWLLTMVRDGINYPSPRMTPGVVAGLNRTTHALSLRSDRVIMGHADLSALPAVAAGAEYVGSGWDLRHRACAPQSFARTTGPRRQSNRVTHEGLLASLKQDEAERLRAGDPTLAATVLPGPTLPPDFPTRWRHDLGVLTRMVESVAGAGGREQRVHALRSMYDAAAHAFELVTPLAAPLQAGPQLWLDPMRQGLELYAAGEGW